MLYCRPQEQYEVRLDDPYRQEEALVASGCVTGPHSRGLPPRAVISSGQLSDGGNPGNPGISSGQRGIGSNPGNGVSSGKIRSSSGSGSSTTLPGQITTSGVHGVLGSSASTGVPSLHTASPPAAVHQSVSSNTSDWSKRVTLGSIDAWPRPQKTAVQAWDQAQGLNNVVPGLSSTGRGAGTIGTGISGTTTSGTALCDTASSWDGSSTTTSSTEEGEEVAENQQGEALEAWFTPQRRLYQGYTPSSRLVWPHHARRQHAPSSSALQ
jgi:hypothetical protein